MAELTLEEWAVKLGTTTAVLSKWLGYDKPQPTRRLTEEQVKRLVKFEKEPRSE